MFGLTKRGIHPSPGPLQTGAGRTVEIKDKVTEVTFTFVAVDESRKPRLVRPREVPLSRVSLRPSSWAEYNTMLLECALEKYNYGAGDNHARPFISRYLTIDDFLHDAVSSLGELGTQLARAEGGCSRIYRSSADKEHR